MDNINKQENTNTYSDMVIEQMLIEIYSRIGVIKAEVENNNLTGIQKRAIIHIYDTMIKYLN